MVAHVTLSAAVSKAVALLVDPIVSAVARQTVERLRASLEANLVKEYENNWFPTEPQRGSKARCLSLSPSRLPPRPVLAAGFAARLPWSHWMSLLGNKEFDLFVDPGVVSMRVGAKPIQVVWSSAQAALDDEFDEVCTMINREMSASSWISPLLPQFPEVPAPATRASLAPALRMATAARSASRLSNASASDSDCDSAFSGPPSLIGSDSVSSVSSRASSGVYVPPARRGLGFSAPAPAPARYASSSSSVSSSDESDDVFFRGREQLMRPRIDTSKTHVTVYDAGKTTVLAGGVMLGMAAPPKKRALLC